MYREFFRARLLRGRRHGRASGGCFERGCTGVENEPGGVSRSVWWANVCLLAASEPVNHYGLRKRLRPIFALLQPSFSPFNPLSLFPTQAPRPSTSRFSFDSPHSLSLSFSPLVPFHSSLSVAFSRSSPSFPSVASSPRCLRATSTLQCCPPPPPPILHI